MDRLSPGTGRDSRRALLVCEYFPPTVGGAARWAGDLLDHARTLRWTVLTRPVEGAPAREARGRHWVIRLPAWEDPPPSFLSWRTWRAARRVRAEVDRLLAEGIAVVHAVPAHFSGLAALGPCRRRGVPLVVHVMGEEFGMLGRRPTRRALFRRVLARADAVVAISPRTREEAVALGAEPERTRLLVGVDVERFRPPASDEERAALRRRWGIDGRRALLTVGRLVPRKGIDVAIEAVARLVRDVPDLVYLVAGDGPDRPRLEGVARVSGVADRVRFLGRVADGDLPGLYGSADVFVTVNREIEETGEVEGFGLVFVEAGACGTPSIAGRSGGAAHAVRDGETGLVVEPRDAGAVAAAVRLLLDEERRRRLGAAARRLAETEFSWARVGPAIEALGLGET